MSTGGSAGSATGGTGTGGTGIGGTGTAGSGTGGMSSGGAAGQPGTGGTGGMGDDSCRTNDDCRQDQYCAKNGCDADAKGECEDRPTQCSNDPEPVCGCDGVNYWNDCLREQSGVASSRSGECGNDRAICREGPPGPSVKCPNDRAVCGRLLENKTQCGGSGGVVPAGACWVLPASCPTLSADKLWAECGSSLPFCLGTCEALKTTEPHYPCSGLN